ncbi:MAG: VOC family protein [Planctomycetes bacterium]|nr:VOC family protein [Planctomycetota bacterium]MBI3847049.1 VOC family protein [Planctomycetota bacterium]
MATKAKPIPDGFYTITPSLIVKGAAKAIEFYKKAFGATERYRMTAPNGTVGHAEITIGNSIVMIADEMPEMGLTSPTTLKGTASGLLIYTENTDAAFKRAIDAGATPILPPTDMFWGGRYSRLMDPFGHIWAISTQLMDLTHDEMIAAYKEFVAKQPVAAKH